MEIIIQSSPVRAANVAASIIARLLRGKPGAVLGLATGSTPLQPYQTLIDMQLDWSRVTTFNLDEYIGLPREHPQGYHSFMWENLFKHINITRENIHIPDGNSRDIPRTCQDYEAQIRAAGGIDIQVLGIGTDGHIGFNEPTSSLASRTRSKNSQGNHHRHPGIPGNLGALRHAFKTHQDQDALRRPGRTKTEKPIKGDRTGNVSRVVLTA